MPKPTNFQKPKRCFSAGRLSEKRVGDLKIHEKKDIKDYISDNKYNISKSQDRDGNNNVNLKESNKTYLNPEKRFINEQQQKLQNMIEQRDLKIKILNQNYLKSKEEKE